MEKMIKRLGIGVLIVLILAGLWLFAYKLQKDTDNLPSLASISQRDDAYADEKLKGYRRIQLITVWGEPEIQTGKEEDIWQFDDTRGIRIYYNGREKVTEASLVVRFHEDWLTESELSAETLDWLKMYNDLPEEMQLFLSYVPADIVQQIRGDLPAVTMETPAEASREEPENELNKEALTPTGYPSDEIDQPQLMYEGRIFYYWATGFKEPLPESFVLAGTVEKVDNKNKPENDWEGSRLEEGQEIYADPEQPGLLYVRYPNGFARFSETLIE